MADERSPLLQNGREHDDYSAVNGPEQADSVAIQGSTDAEQQQTVEAPQYSIITLVRIVRLFSYFFILTFDEGDTNGDRNIFKCNGPNDCRQLYVTYSFMLLNLERPIIVF